MKTQIERDYITNKFLDSISLHSENYKQADFLESRLSLCVEVFEGKRGVRTFYGSNGGNIHKGPIQQLCGTLKQVNIVYNKFSIQ